MRLSLFSTQMRYFAAVAQTGSVSSAAGRLHVAASAVSRQIAKLEDALGAPLFDRQRRGMALTPAGERLAAHLRAGADEAERVIEQVRGLAGHSGQRLRLACTEGFAGGFVPGVVRAFRTAHPEAHFELIVAEPDETRALLLRGEVDLALKYSVAPERGLTVLHSAIAPVFALMRPAHALARRRTVSVADVVRHPLALGTPGTTGRRLFDQSCSAHGLQYEAVAASNFSSTLLPLIGDDEIVPGGYLTAVHLVAAGELVAVPFAEAELQQRRLQLLSLEGRALSPIVQAFAQQVIAAIEGYGKRKIGHRRAARSATKKS